MTSVTQQTKNLRELSRQRTAEVLNQPGSTQRFAPSPLATINPAFARTTSFLPSSVANPLAGSFQQQRTPGAQYANYERMAPNIGGPLTAPQVPAGFVPPGTQPETIRVYPDGSPVPDVVDEEDDSSSSPLDEALKRINEMRIAQGKEPFESMAEFQADLRNQIGIGMEGGFNPFGGRFAEGGIASLDPQEMFLGGLMSAIGQGATAAGGALAKGATALGGAAAKGLGGLKDIALKGIQNYNENMAAAGGTGALGGKRLEDMTREELLEYIKSGGVKKGLTGNQKLGKAIAGGLGFDTSAYGEMAQGGLMSLSKGGDVDFPRMNGPISGPGTETSDDIPAMLSDGEFVVNAKAVRGIGRLEGAGKSKEEQRREGARMMYALQRAGEKAMRKA